MQNSYEQNAKSWYVLQQSNRNLAHKYLEKPAIYSLLPQNLKNKSIHCLGCGSGVECQHLYEKGANVIGSDNSNQLLEYAKSEYPQIVFEYNDMNNLTLEANKYDIVFSSLAFHYIDDWDQLLSSIHKSLKKEGQLIFSTHHPIKWGGQKIRNKDFNQFTLGYQKSKQNSNEYKVWGDYLNSRKIDDKLFGKIDIQIYHKSISTMLNLFIKNGFAIDNCLEPQPTQDSKKYHPDFYHVYSKIPLFVIFRLKKIDINK